MPVVLFLSVVHSSKKLIGCNKGVTRVFNDVLRVFQDMLEKVFGDGDDIITNSFR